MKQAVECNQIAAAVSCHVFEPCLLCLVVNSPIKLLLDSVSPRRPAHSNPPIVCCLGHRKYRPSVSVYLIPRVIKPTLRAALTSGTVTTSLVSFTVNHFRLFSFNNNHTALNVCVCEASDSSPHPSLLAARDVTVHQTPKIMTVMIVVFRSSALN